MGWRWRWQSRGGLCYLGVRGWLLGAVAWESPGGGAGRLRLFALLFGFVNGWSLFLVVGVVCLCLRSLVVVSCFSDFVVFFVCGVGVLFFIFFWFFNICGVLGLGVVPLFSFIHFNFPPL